MAIPKPPVISEVFCSGGTVGVDYIIPPKTSVDVDIITQEVGVPISQATPLGLNGVPVERNQFNGVWRLYSSQAAWNQQGGTFTFEPSFILEQGGYPIGSVLWCESNRTYQYSLINNNVANFITTPSFINDGINWQQLTPDIIDNISTGDVTIGGRVANSTNIMQTTTATGEASGVRTYYDTVGSTARTGIYYTSGGTRSCDIYASKNETQSRYNHNLISYSFSKNTFDASYNGGQVLNQTLVTNGGQGTGVLNYPDLHQVESSTGNSFGYLQVSPTFCRIYSSNNLSGTFSGIASDPFNPTTARPTLYANNVAGLAKGVTSVAIVGDLPQVQSASTSTSASNTTVELALTLVTTKVGTLYITGVTNNAAQANSFTATLSMNGTTIGVPLNTTTTKTSTVAVNNLAIGGVVLRYTTGSNISFQAELSYIFIPNV